MEQSLKEAEKEYIKVINKEKVLEFKYDENSGFEESEIILENKTQENIISKIYINNYKYFKCSPNILIITKNSISKIKVMMDNKDYLISNSDIFLIISHPLDNFSEEYDEKKMNEIFKSNNYKEKGQKIFLVGYKKKVEKKEEKEDELVKRIKELEKEVFEGVKEEKEKKEVDSKEIKEKEIKKKTSFCSFVCLLILYSLLFYITDFFLMKFLDIE